jgi:AhpC/TSA family
MVHLLVCAALAPLWVTADAPLSAATQLNFRGQLEAAGGEQDSGRKTFDLTLWITEKSDTGAGIFWLVEERGRGEFPWPARFGRVGVDARWNTASPGPALLYDRGDGRSAVPIALPFFTSEQPLSPGLSFDAGQLSAKVDKATKAAEKPAWRVSLSDPFGPKRVVTVDQHSPLVLAMTEKVIMGRGNEYQLKLEWVGSEALNAQQNAALAKVTDALVALTGKLNLQQRAQEADWNKDQLALLGEQLPRVAELAVATPLAKFVGAAQRDLEVQSGRSNGVAELAAKFVGREVEDFSARGLGEGLSLATLKGQVTVLHFWDYRDEPLKEPYGQVGYLDFIYHRRKAAGLQVFGVAVDGRLGDEKTRAAAERSVRKLTSFMNVSYPVVFDSGSIIKQFGDPRVVGASLPLFVVVGPDQKILHYHVGNYTVHQDQGLRELDQVLAEAMAKR